MKRSNTVRTTGCNVISEKWCTVIGRKSWMNSAVFLHKLHCFGDQLWCILHLFLPTIHCSGDWLRCILHLFMPTIHCFGDQLLHIMPLFLPTMHYFNPTIHTSLVFSDTTPSVFHLTNYNSTLIYWQKSNTSQSIIKLVFKVLNRWYFHDVSILIVFK